MVAALCCYNGSNVLFVNWPDLNNLALREAQSRLAVLDSSRIIKKKLLFNCSVEILS